MMAHDPPGLLWRGGRYQTCTSSNVYAWLRQRQPQVAPRPFIALAAISAAVSASSREIAGALATVLEGRIRAVYVRLSHLLLLEPMLETSVPQVAHNLPGRLGANVLALSVRTAFGRGGLGLAGLGLVAFLLGCLVMRRREAGDLSLPNLASGS
jgi:hypothetical protein